jgi:hypothetical protein
MAEHYTNRTSIPKITHILAAHPPKIAEDGAPSLWVRQPKGKIKGGAPGWSSAGAHCGAAQSDLALDTDTWKRQWNSTTWKQYLSEPDAEADAEAIRQCTHTGRPLGTAEFVETLEKTVGRILTAQKGGRRPKVANRTNQDLFQFD